METDSGMDRLASCYFCGVAVEAPLEEYPVVPRDLRPSVEDQSTVVLCPECRRKLSTIVERVVTVATDPGQSELTGEGNQQTLGESDGPRDVERSHDGPSVLEGFDHDSPDLLEVSDTESADDVEDRSGEPSTTTNQQSGHVSATDERDIPDDERDDPAESEREETGASFFEREQPARPESTTEGEPEADSDEDPATEPKAHSSAGGDEPGAEEPERAFSRSSYNRVVKLLQNRSFPVEIEAIVTVAESAYEIDEDDSQAILDALVDRGVIERDGGKLRRPETKRED